MSLLNSKKPITIYLNTLMTTMSNGVEADLFTGQSTTVAEGFFNLKKSGSSMLSPVVRGFSTDYRWIMVERPPVIAELYVAGETKSTNVPIPWTIWVIELDKTKVKSLYIYARPEVTITGDAMLYQLPFPAVASNGKTFNPIIHNEINIKSDLQSKIHAILYSWSHGFTGEEEAWTDLKRFKDHTPLSVLDLEYEPADAPKVLNLWHEETIGKPISVLTVDHWIQFFEWYSDSLETLEPTNAPVTQILYNLAEK